MSEAGQGHARPKFNSDESGHTLGYHRYFSYYRVTGWNEGEFQITGTVNTVNSEGLNPMLSWYKFFIPAALRKKDGFVDVEYEALHLTSAMGDLTLEVTRMKKDRKHMNQLLDDVVQSVGRKKSK